MTIFDVIRYPLSNPPTLDEKDALPASIYFKYLLELMLIPAENRTDMRYKILTQCLLEHESDNEKT